MILLRRLAVLLGVLALVALPGAARADNAAVAINTKDGSSVFRFAFKVARVGQEVVDEANAAVAFANCTDCQTIAIAIQVVLVMGDPDVVAPENLALAINEGCTLCETLASAYQFVFLTGGAVHFTAEGNEELARLRHAFQELRKEAEGLSAFEVQARIETLVERLRVVLANELVPAGRSGTTGTATTTPATTTAPATTATEPPPTTAETTTETTPATTESTPTTTETTP